jgi:hypothetical protein
VRTSAAMLPDPIEVAKRQDARCAPSRLGAGRAVDALLVHGRQSTTPVTLSMYGPLRITGLRHGPFAVVCLRALGSSAGYIHRVILARAFLCSCLDVEVANSSILSTERPARHFPLLKALPRRPPHLHLAQRPPA